MPPPSPDPAQVLVVDDEVPICKIITRILVSKGFSARGVSERDKVRTVVKENRFDIILLDRSMVKAKDDDLLANLRTLAPQAKILFFTGEFVEERDAALVDGVIQKPVNGQTLSDTLHRLID